MELRSTACGNWADEIVSAARDGYAKGLAGAASNSNRCVLFFSGNDSGEVSIMPKKLSKLSFQPIFARLLD